MRVVGPARPEESSIRRPDCLEHKAQGPVPGTGAHVSGAVRNRVGSDFRPPPAYCFWRAGSRVERRFGTRSFWGVGGSGLAAANRNRCICSPDCLSVASVVAASRSLGGGRNIALGVRMLAPRTARRQRLPKWFEDPASAVGRPASGGLTGQGLREEFIEYVICGLQEELSNGTTISKPDSRHSAMRSDKSRWSSRLRRNDRHGRRSRPS